MTIRIKELLLRATIVPARDTAKGAGNSVPVPDTGGTSESLPVSNAMEQMLDEFRKGRIEGIKTSDR
jgi:hypothetical protein